MMSEYVVTGNFDKYVSITGQSMSACRFNKEAMVLSQ
jgi:hypothetical protein